MEKLCCDTNVWIDFSLINQIDLPFRLTCMYMMNKDAVEDELLNPKELGATLISLGMECIDLTIDEFFLAESYSVPYPRLSRYDRTALAISKLRVVTLLTGDLALRKAAEKEGVKILGTIGILDLLHDQSLISDQEFYDCLSDLLALNGKQIRLPENELKERIKKLEQDKL